MNISKTDYKESSYIQSMMISKFRKLIPIFICSAGLLLAGCGGDSGNSTGPDPDPDPDPNEPNRAVSFSEDISPILSTNCATSGCHNSSTQESGVNLSSYDAALGSVGSQYGTEIIDPGNPDSSPIIDKISNDNPEFGVRMPENRPSLSSADIDSIRAWIEDGAPNN